MTAAPTGGQQIAASGTGVTGGDVWDSFARRYVPGTWDWTTGGGTVLRDWLNRSGDAGSREVAL